MNLMRLCAFVAGIAISLASYSQDLPYTTGFEPAEGYILGVYGPGPIDATANWNVEDGTAAIRHTVVYEDLQALEIGPLSAVDAPRSGGAAQTIWVQGAYRGMPQDEDPDISGLGPRSALLYFNTTQGVMVYDGLADPADWVEVGASVNSESWYLITIRLDFASRTWDLYLGDSLIAEGIGFMDPTLSTYNGFRYRASQNGSDYFDSFYVGLETPANIPVPTLVWVDFDYSGAEKGTESYPYNTLAEGVDGVQAGGTVRIKAGDTAETLQVTKEVRLESEGGQARIGIQP